MSTLPIYEWTRNTCGGTPPTPREGHSAVLVDKLVYIFGGYNGRWHNGTYLLDTETMFWSKVPNSVKMPAPRSAHTATLVSANGRRWMVIFGGHNGDATQTTNSYFSDVWAMDLETNSWIEIQTRSIAHGSKKPKARDGHVAAAIGPWLFIFGGYNGQQRSDMWALDCRTWVWMPVTVAVNPADSKSIKPVAVQLPRQNTRPSKRTAHSAAAVISDPVGKGDLFVFGGDEGSGLLGDGAGHSLNDMHVFHVDVRHIPPLHPETNMLVVQSINAPDDQKTPGVAKAVTITVAANATTPPTSVPTTPLALVQPLGGDEKKASPAPTPSVGSKPVAQRTIGNKKDDEEEYQVWTGFACGVGWEPVRLGVDQDPLEVPRPRNNHNLVLFPYHLFANVENNTDKEGRAGPELFVFGGADGNRSYLNTLHRFSLTARTWQQITTRNTPSGRDTAAAVVVGSRLIIIGGSAGPVYMNDVAVLNLIPTASQTKPVHGSVEEKGAPMPQAANLPAGAMPGHSPNAAGGRQQQQRSDVYNAGAASGSAANAKPLESKEAGGCCVVS